MQSSHRGVPSRDLRAAAVRPIAGVLLVAAMGLGLSACESVQSPDWIDPASWFKDETPAPRTEAAAATRRRAEAAAEAAADQPFPKLATVPVRPNTANASVRQRVAEGLVADRENARYTAAAVARLGFVAVPPDDAPAVGSQNDGVTDVPVEVATIYFADTSTSLQPGDEAVLRDVAALHAQLGGSLLLVGHDSRGQNTIDTLDDKVAKLDVSLDRALAVADMLAQLGVDPDKVAIEGRGDNQLQYQEATPIGEAGNRRTVVYLLR